MHSSLSPNMLCVMNDAMVPCKVMLKSGLTGEVVETCHLVPGAQCNLPCMSHQPHSLEMLFGDGVCMSRDVTVGAMGHMCCLGTYHPSGSMTGGMGSMSSMSHKAGMGKTFGVGGMGSAFHMGGKTGMGGMGMGEMVQFACFNDSEAPICLTIMDPSCTTCLSEMCIAPGGKEQCMVPAGMCFCILEKEDGCRLRLELNCTSSTTTSCSELMSCGMMAPMTPLLPHKRSFICCADLPMDCEVSLTPCGSFMGSMLGGKVASCSLSPGHCKVLDQLEPGCYTVHCAFADGTSCAREVDLTRENAQFDLSVLYGCSRAHGGLLHSGGGGGSRTMGGFRGLGGMMGMGMGHGFMRKGMGMGMGRRSMMGGRMGGFFGGHHVFARL